MKANALPIGIGASMLLACLYFACLHLDRPALYYDEILFVNAAVGGVTDSFIAKHVLGIPLYLMDYIGALKAWIHAPIFALFGLDATTIRLPSILIGTTGGLLLCLVAWRWFGASAFTIAALLIFTQPAFIGHLRFDWGPTSLMFLFRGLLLWSCLRWVESGTPRWLWVTVLAMLLGTFDKLNFLWLDYAALAALLMVYRVELQSFYRDHSRHFWLAALVVALVILGNTRRALRLSNEMPDNSLVLSSRLAYVWIVVREFALGNGVANFISQTAPAIPVFAMAAYAGVVALAASTVYWLRDRTTQRIVAFLTLVTAGTFAAYVLTPTATGPHHLAILLGLPQLVLAALLAIGCARAGIAYRVATGLLLSAILVGHLLTDQAQVESFTRPRPNLDPANYQAALFASRLPNAHLTLTDWGIGNQIVVASGGKAPFVEAAWAIRDAKSAAAVLAHREHGRNNYYIGRLPGRASIADNWPRVIEALQSTGTGYLVIQDFPDYRGEPFIRILKIDAP
ncbi:MAG: glycosyltransferase family 39 protein [Betaproteobacteria bacterium]|nr:glycosyltransferase family 39 protein [Betaproteobacteria bacterium]